MSFAVPTFQPLRSEQGQIGSAVSAVLATLVYGDAYNLAFFYQDAPPVSFGPAPSNAYQFNHTGVNQTKTGGTRRPTGKYLRHSNTLPRPFYYDPDAAGPVEIDSPDWENVTGIKNYFCYNSTTYMNYLMHGGAEFYADIYHPRAWLRFYAEVASEAEARLVVYDNIGLTGVPVFIGDSITVASADVNTVMVDMDATPEYRDKRLNYADASTMLYAVLQVKSDEGIAIQDNPTALIQTWPGFALTTLE